MTGMMTDELTELRSAVCRELGLSGDKWTATYVQDRQFRNWDELLVALVDDWLELRHQSLDRHRDELRDRLVWCLKHRGGPLADGFQWSLCHSEMAATVDAYSDSSPADSAADQFVVGTCDSLFRASRNELVRGRGVNDFRKGIYLFPPTAPGRKLAREVALLRARHQFSAGHPLILTVSVNSSLWQPLLKLDLRLPKDDLLLAGLARQFDLRTSAFADSVAHAYNYYDVICAPLTEWSPFGWRSLPIDAYQVVIRTRLAQSLLTIENVEPVSPPQLTPDIAKVQRRDYFEYWEELPLSSEASPSEIQSVWSECLAFPMFGHEHPMYFAAPYLLPHSVWTQLSTPARFDLIDSLTVLCGNAPNPDCQRIRRELEKYS